MVKADVAEEIARVTEVSKKEAKVILEAILDAMVKALWAGERVELRGFGTFSTRARGPRQGRNPRTGAKVDVPARRIPRFRSSRELIALLNGLNGGEPRRQR
jgi:integration host factor subunit beta